MVKEAKAHAEDSPQARKDIEARNTADQPRLPNRELLEKTGTRCRPRRARHPGRIEDVAQAMEAGGKDAINEALKRLGQAVHRLAEVRTGRRRRNPGVRREDAG